MGGDALTSPSFFASRGHLLLTDQVRAQLNTDGYVVDYVENDGKIHRFKMDSSDNRKSGWYACYRNFSNSGEEFLICVYGSWRTDDVRTFCTLVGERSKYDQKQIDEQITKAKRNAKLQRERDQATAAEEARKKLDSLSREGQSEYLKRKQVEPCEGLLFDNFNGDVYAPITDGTEIISYQRISANGQKQFASGCRTKSGFFIIRHSVQQGDQAIICEGLATGLSLAKGSGAEVFVGFTAHNLSDVATFVRSKFPEREIIICADNDRFKEENIGINAATKAAEQIGAAVVSPTFTQDKGTDFNDLHCIEGLDRVKAQLEGIKSVKVSPEISVVLTPYPDEDLKTSKRLGTALNISELVRRLGIKVRYNIMTKRVDFSIPNFKAERDNWNNTCETYIKDWCVRAKIPSEHLHEYLDFIAQREPYHPVIEWIESKPWDGKLRIKELCDTIKVKEKEKLKNILIFRWLVSAVAALYRPEGVSAHGVLVFTAKQATGKTSWFKKLVPDHLRARDDGKALRPDDKDSVYQACSRWLVELGELDGTFRKSDMALLKAFLTKDRDEMRRPFARNESEYPRRTIFFGSVNEVSFLNDSTGNRRFWTIEPIEINYKHDIDMQQLWAEVVHEYRDGAPWILQPDELSELNKHNEEFMPEDPIEDKIRRGFNWQQQSMEATGRWLTATQVLETINERSISRKELNSAGRALRRMGASQKTVHGVRLYLLPSNY